MDNFFTSYELVQQLKANGITSVGTVRKNKRFVPPEFKPQNRRPIGENLFGFRLFITISSHVPKKNKAVIFLSSLHREPVVEESGKSAINLYYNETKAGVDVLDQLAHTYSVQRQTNRWTNALFMNMINVAGIAAFVVYRNVNGITSEWRTQRKLFLNNLADELTYDHIIRRSKLHLSKTHKRIIDVVIGDRVVASNEPQAGPSNAPEVSASEESQTEESGPSPAKRAKKHCYLCPRTINRKQRQTCYKCQKHVCNEHSVTSTTCNPCVEAENLADETTPTDDLPQ